MWDGLTIEMNYLQLSGYYQVYCHVVERLL